MTRPGEPMRKKVVVVDDSEAIRRLVGHALEADPRLEVVGYAGDAYAARELVRQRSPDVLVLDVEMPRMSGLDFLERVMRLRPMPVIMFSSVTQKGSDEAIRALSLGAVDCIPKPRAGISTSTLADLADRVQSAAAANVRPRAQPTPARPAPQVSMHAKVSRNIVLVGASTGGVAAVETFLRGLPEDMPPVVVAQHMPESYLDSFAKRLDSILANSVSLARDGTELRAGHIYIAPGGICHTGVVSTESGFRATDIEGPRHNGHCPSIDKLFDSAVRYADRVTAVILTGLGRDGARAMKTLRDGGAFCIGQDEATSVVYGMPRAAKELGALDHELPLGEIAAAVARAQARLPTVAGVR